MENYRFYNVDSVSNYNIILICVNVYEKQLDLATLLNKVIVLQNNLTAGTQTNLYNFSVSVSFVH